MLVPAGHQVEKNAISPSAMLRRISRPASMDRFVGRHIRQRRDRPTRNRPSRGALRLWFLRQPTGVSITRGRARARFPTPSRQSAVVCARIGTGGCPARQAHSPCRRAAAPFRSRQRRRPYRPQPRRTARFAAIARTIIARARRGLAAKAGARRHMGRRHPRRIVRPGLGQIQRPVDKRMAMARHIGGEHADLAIRDLAGRSCVLASHTAGRVALLQKARLIENQHGVRIGQGLQRIVTHDVAQCIGVPLSSPQNSLLAPGARIAGRFRPHPTRLASLSAQKSVQKTSPLMLLPAPA